MGHSIKLFSDISYFWYFFTVRTTRAAKIKIYWTQQTHNVVTTSLQRHDVAATLLRRWCDVVCLLGEFELFGWLNDSSCFEWIWIWTEMVLIRPAAREPVPHVAHDRIWPNHKWVTSWQNPSSILILWYGKIWPSLLLGFYLSFLII